MDLPHDPAILEIYPKEVKLACERGTGTPVFVAAQFTIARIWNQTRWSSADAWIKNMLYTA